MISRIRFKRRWLLERLKNLGLYDEREVNWINGIIHKKDCGGSTIYMVGNAHCEVLD